MKLAGLLPAFLWLLLVVSTVAIAQQPPTASGDADATWLLGEWKGTQSSGRSAAQVEIAFKAQDGQIHWELFVRTSEGGLSRAIGLATVSGDSITLDGKYTSGSASGSGLSYSLTRNGDLLTGAGRGRSLTSFSASWKKVK